jgi:hypothetical protein
VLSVKAPTYFATVVAKNTTNNFVKEQHFIIASRAQSMQADIMYTL